jgi:membrane protease YdiL (CAAX protease family)
MFLGVAVGGLFLLFISLGTLMRLIPSLQSTVELIALPAQLLLYALLYLALWAIVALKYDQPLRPSLGFVKSRVPPWQAFASGCILSFVVGLVGAALHTPQVKSPFDRFMSTPGWVILFGIFAVVVGPVFEEIVFRGFIQPLLSRDLGNVAGILITACAFGLLHSPEYSGAWQYVLLITLAGAAFGWVRSWSRSLRPSILMHAGFNSVFLVAALTQNHIQK